MIALRIAGAVVGVVLLGYVAVQHMLRAWRDLL